MAAQVRVLFLVWLCAGLACAQPVTVTKVKGGVKLDFQGKGRPTVTMGTAKGDTTTQGTGWIVLTPAQVADAIAHLQVVGTLPDHSRSGMGTSQASRRALVLYRVGKGGQLALLDYTRADFSERDVIVDPQSTPVLATAYLNPKQIHALIAALEKYR